MGRSPRELTLNLTKLTLSQDSPLRGAISFSYLAMNIDKLHYWRSDNTPRKLWGHYGNIKSKPN
jgi:hypothetical protein